MPCNAFCAIIWRSGAIAPSRGLFILKTCLFAHHSVELYGPEYCFQQHPALTKAQRSANMASKPIIPDGQTVQPIRFHRFKRGTLRERFEGKYVVRANGCWEWIGSRDKLGYGQMRVDSRLRFATHIAMELNGSPRNMEKPCCLHTCDNPACVNPQHLWWGTMRDNTHDMMAKGRQNINGFKIGHEMSRTQGAALIIPCDECGTKFKTSRLRLRTNQHNFCNRACCLKWQSENFVGIIKWRRGQK